MANILVGLHSSSSDHAEVTGVLDALAGKIASAGTSRDGGNDAILRMTEVELSMALWGFYGLSCDKRSVRDFLRTINTNLEIRNAVSSSNKNLTYLPPDEAQNAASSASSGAKSLAQRSPLQPLVFTGGNQLAPAIGGLRKMSNTYEEVEATIKHINNAFSKSVNLNEQNIANILYALQSIENVNSDQINIFLEKMLLCIGNFTGNLYT